MKSAGNEDGVQSRLQVLYIHILPVAPLGARHMAQPRADQHQGGIAVRECPNHAVVSRFMRKFDSGIWQKSITGGVLRRPLGYVWTAGAQRVKGGSRLSCP